MKDLNNYLHLYIGSEAQYQKSFIEYPESYTVTVKLTPKRYYQLDDLSIAKLRLILRPIYGMTEEEKEQLFDHIWPNGLWAIVCHGKIEVIDHALDIMQEWSDLGERVKQQDLDISKQATMFTWLLSKGFDLFGLIESGLAIDKTDF